MSIIDPDPVVASAVRRVPVPPPVPGFWDDVQRRLGRAAITDGHDEVDANGAEPIMVDLAHPAVPSRRRAVLVAAAAATIVSGSLALVATRDGTGVVPATTETSALTDTSAPTATSPGDSRPGSADAVLSFLDTLGRGDLAAAASRLGPMSEAYLEAAAGEVEDFLVVAEEGYGAWVASTDRTTRVVEIAPGEVVVVVSGTLEVEGNVERRSDAFPARYAESAGAWFVEPWAVDPQLGSEPPRIEVVRSTARTITATTIGEGTAWLSVDDGSPIPVDVGQDHRAHWELTQPLDGDHTLVVAFINETTFTAIAVQL